MGISLVILVGVLVFLMIVPAIVRGPRRRGPLPPWLRTVCGVTGILLVVGVMFGTLACLRDIKVESSPPIALTRPTRPAPEISVDKAKNTVDAKPQRFLVHCMLVEDAMGDVRCLQAKTHTVRWPEEKGKTLSTTFSVNGDKVDITLDVARLVPVIGEPGQTVQCEGSRSVRQTRYSSSGSFSCRMDGATVVDQMIASGLRRPAWSLVKRQEANRYIVVLVDRATLDDPLAQRNVSERLADVRTVLAQWPRQDTGYRHTQRGSPVAKEWGEHFGSASVILCAAALLLALACPMPQIAFVACVLAVVLATVGTDTVSVRRLVRAAQDKGSGRSDSERASLALRLAYDSFFFSESARRSAKELAMTAGETDEFRKVLLGDVSMDLATRLKTAHVGEWRSTGLTNWTSLPVMSGTRDTRSFDFTSGTWPSNPTESQIQFDWPGRVTFRTGQWDSWNSRAARVDRRSLDDRQVPFRYDWNDSIEFPRPGETYVLYLTGKRDPQVATEPSYVLIRFTHMEENAVRFDWARLE